MRAVNAAFTIALVLPLAFEPAVWQEPLMVRRNSKAGGFWLILAIIVGTALGIWQGQPSIGVLAGTAVGILLAVGIYLRDRARSGE